MLRCFVEKVSNVAILRILVSLFFPTFGTFILWTAYFPVLSHYLFHDYLFLLNNNVFFVIFNLIFWFVFMTSGWFMGFIHVSVYFLPISEHFSRIISPELNVNFLGIFFYPYLVPHVRLHVSNTSLFFFIGILAAVISWTSTSSSFLHCSLKCLCHLVLNI